MRPTVNHWNVPFCAVLRALIVKPGARSLSKAHIHHHTVTCSENHEHTNDTICEKDGCAHTH